MASMENKSNKSSKSEGKMASKGRRFASLDGLEEHERDDIHSYLNKLLAAVDVVDAKKAKNRPITKSEQNDIDDNLQKLLDIVLAWCQRPRPSPRVPANQTPPSLGLEARRLLRKTQVRIQDGLEDDKVMAESTYADELLGMVKEFTNELGIDAVQPDKVWEPSDAESNDGQGLTLEEAAAAEAHNKTAMDVSGTETME